MALRRARFDHDRPRREVGVGVKDPQLLVKGFPVVLGVVPEFDPQALVVPACFGILLIAF